MYSRRKRNREEYLWNKVLDHWYTNLLLAYAKELVENDILGYSCTFCITFRSCDGCPIREWSKNNAMANGCDDTPWKELYNYVSEEKLNQRKLLRLVTNQIKFLEELYSGRLT